MPLSSIAQRYDQFILDLDGCVWIGEEPTPRAVEAIDALREDGKDVAYATNDPRSATEDYVARLWKIVSSKNPLRASEANDAAAFGEIL